MLNRQTGSPVSSLNAPIQPDALFADSESEQDQVLKDHRRHVERSFVLFGCDDFSLPEELAGIDVEREEIAVGSRPDDSPVFDGGAAFGGWISTDLRLQS